MLFDKNMGNLPRFCKEILRVRNNGTCEGFCTKTSPVTPSFYCFNIILLLRGNVRKKILKSCGRKFLPWANCRFSEFSRNRLRKIILNCCAFSFSDAKSYFQKKKNKHEVTEYINLALITYAKNQGSKILV